MINLGSFILIVGLVSMLWRIAIKYDLVDRFYLYTRKLGINWVPEVCVMCVTFWTTLLCFLIADPNISFFYNFLRAISATPFILELTRKEWS